MQEWEETIARRRVLVTGHTGFTGSWLCLWLHMLGCKISGLSLAPNTTPSLYELLAADDFIDSHIQDIRDASATAKIIKDVEPDCIIHLAAQPLVRASYSDPITTFSTNVMGTAHVLEAARNCKPVKSLVCVTTDKVYQNKEWIWPYRETDTLGGKDPYSASKSATEMVVETYRQALNPHGNNFAMASARGGNIIGGGDWAEDRIVPDFVRAVTDKNELVLRNPEATRPWQHVLALVQGYLMLTAHLLEDRENAEGAWNFGPRNNEAASVRTLVEGFSKHWERPRIDFQVSEYHEAHFLALDSTKARSELNWSPPWAFDDVLRETAQWYAAVLGGDRSAIEACREQLNAYRTGLNS